MQENYKKYVEAINKIYEYLNFNNIERYRERYIYELILSYYAHINQSPIIIPSVADPEPSIYLNMRIYNKNYDLKNKIIYTDTLDNAISEYYKNGGRKINEQELENPRMYKLLSKNFVLYGK